jgi:hypothetical protein
VLQPSKEDGLVELLCFEMQLSELTTRSMSRSQPAAAAAAAAALLAGALEAAGAAPLLTAAFPPACDIAVSCPLPEGHLSIALVLSGATAAARTSTATAAAAAAAAPTCAAPHKPARQERHEGPGGCIRTAPAAVTLPEGELLAAFAAELGRRLGIAMKEQREVRKPWGNWRLGCERFGGS